MKKNEAGAHRKKTEGGTRSPLGTPRRPDTQAPEAHRWGRDAAGAKRQKRARPRGRTRGAEATPARHEVGEKWKSGGAGWSSGRDNRPDASRAPGRARRNEPHTVPGVRRRRCRTVRAASCRRQNCRAVQTQGAGRRGGWERTGALRTRPRLEHFPLMLINSLRVERN